MTKGYQLTFYTQQNRKHGHQPLGEWLLEEAQRLGIEGATLLTAVEGFGHGRKIHSAHFFDLSDQPIEVTMAVSVDGAERMFDRLRKEGIKVFYVKAAIEYGMTGEL